MPCYFVSDQSTKSSRSILNTDFEALGESGFTVKLREALSSKHLQIRYGDRLPFWTGQMLD